jgi:HD-GYP domain-containing protein (c-di-GMP phosphodiesterase class II)
MEQDPALTLRRERLLSAFFMVAGLTALFFSFKVNPWKLLSEQAWMALLFSVSVVVADQFPIHLTRGTKASITSLPIYLGMVLLPAPLAILAAGSGVMIAEIRARNERGLFPRDISATTGQWMVTTYIASRVFHLDLTWLPDRSATYILLIAGALTFLFMDFIAFAISSTYILKEPFFRVLKSTVREGTGVEATQYAIAILGALVILEDRWLLPLLIVPSIITYVTFKSIKEVKNDTLSLLEDMADTVDLRDVYTGGHSRRVADLVTQTLSQLNIFGHEAEIIVTAARLHDIGKIGIPDDILKKPGRLTPEEMRVMQSHSEKGADLISKYKTFARGVAMIRHHHERWDGHGYPDRIRDYEIPFGARLIAVADSFDAMTSDRPYRKALSEKQAIQILLEGRGGQWDPEIVNTFVDLFSEGIREEFSPGERRIAPLLPQKATAPVE